MTTIRTLRAVFLETLRLFRADPLGMLGVVFCQLLLDKAPAQKRLKAILNAHPKRVS
jgi:hypothetical protein